MMKYNHESHCVTELREGDAYRATILFVHEYPCYVRDGVIGGRGWLSQFDPINFHFHRRKTGLPDRWVRWHTSIRLPFFWYVRDGSGIRIGTWFHYLWFIRPIRSGQKKSDRACGFIPSL